MFDIGWSELVVIGVVALIAIGPKELPTVLRTVGQWMGKIRRMAAEFQGQFQEAMREAEMADIKKQVDEMTSAASSLGNFDPLDSVRKEVEGLTDLPASSPEAPAPTAAPADAGAAEALPAPVASELGGPQPAADLAPAEAPQPKAGSGG